jgi:exopolysaccharide production protein ExoY
VLLALTAPLFAAVALINKLTSPGPVLFAQKRLGLNGRPFMVLQVPHHGRQRRSGAEAERRSSTRSTSRTTTSCPTATTRGSPGPGRFLRATSLDELPQLFNVLKGDMSLVGPRPVVPSEVENYADYATLFLSAKPGMTGHWQVSGRSEIKEYARRVELDLEYIRDQSLSKDLEILLRTVPAVLMRRGAH